jgi:hypothetical protein
MLVMDRRREVQRWLSLRDREGLTYRDLSARSGIPANTLAHWAWRLRREGRSTRESTPFVELVPGLRHEDSAAGRVEIVLRGERRVLVDAAIEPAALTRLLLAIERC